MSCNAQQCTAAALTTISVVGGAYLAYHLYQKRNKLPTEWTLVGTLQELNIYPIKSCHPVAVDEAEVTYLGLKNGWLRDRVLMIVDDSYKFITARQYPELLRVRPTIKAAMLTLEHPAMEPIHIDLAEISATRQPKEAKIWFSIAPVLDCGSLASQWLTKLLDKPFQSFRLVYYASQYCRGNNDPCNKAFNFTKNDTGAFPDDTSFNLLNQASVDDLNIRLKESQVTAQNFRPNFILGDGSAKAYDEDNWKYIKIGDVIFEIVKPCTRCVLTTIDPETGVRDPGNEPLKTLKTYRQIYDKNIRKSVGESPRMGSQMALRSEPGGLIHLNDPIYVA